MNKRINREKYKPGQLITVDNCVYRIKRHTKPFDWVSLNPEANPCLKVCKNRNIGIFPSVCEFCLRHLRYSDYLIPVIEVRKNSAGTIVIKYYK